jgi:putative selenate reductase
MSDILRVQPFDALLHWILQEYSHSNSIFGIHRSLFYEPRPYSPYASTMFGQPLATPIGPAAGPHTQLAPNIVCAWLAGGRFIELKTVQIMDELTIPRPCIDMADEGYNVEWSQELKLEQSAGEYIKAWALIHILRRLLGWEEIPLATIFNMSVGYNLEGIQSPPMTRFMERLADASAEMAEIQGVVQKKYPQFADIEIPPRLVNSVTLSTMHGCPPDEIERIARYLLEERGLHTMVKLNPTLLGEEAVLHILHQDLGFGEMHIPHSVFEQDLRYDRAVALIRALQQVAAGRNLTFGVKLSNTLAMANHKRYLPGSEMYLSGRALYPLTMNLFHKLAQEFGGDLSVSYSAGADALNVATILSCGARPVTAASDLLKPGGYARLGQYLEKLEAEMRARGAAGLDELARDRLANLERAAAAALQDPRYKKSYHPFGLPKVESALGRFDCIAAPCVEQCAVGQDVPEYAWLIAQGEYDRALEVILSRNPLPAVTGYVCTHLCQTRCTRNDYEQPVAIRALKCFAAEHGKVSLPAGRAGAALLGRPVKVAVVGSGPSGLAAAYFLALNGVQVTILEARGVAGGMLSLAPAFRLPPRVVAADIQRITALGVRIELEHPLKGPPEDLLRQGFEAVYVACGLPKDAPLQIEALSGPWVYSALDLLERVARGERVPLGAGVLVIGGGNTALDAARTARRLTGNPATIVYRRTRAEMPAEPEEIADLLAEGNVLQELVSPRRVLRRDGRVVGLECVRNELGAPGADGRRRPVPVPGSEFTLPADAIIVAIGQGPDLVFLDKAGLPRRENGTIIVDPATGRAGRAGVYAGGDAVRGPGTIIAACADGRRAAEAICRQLGLPFTPPPAHPAALSAEEIVQVKEARARQEAQQRPAVLPVEQRRSFELVEGTLAEAAARQEAARCLQCSTFCDKCVEVCPNRANHTCFVEPVQLSLPLLSCQDGRLAVVGEETFQVEQVRQIVHLDDLCNECGNCATFCVHQGKPYLDKPRLFLREEDFLAENDNAFYIQGSVVRRREAGRESRLALGGEVLAWENEQVRVVLTPAFQVRELVLKQPFAGTLSLKEAAEMAVLLHGIKGSLPFLVQ